MRIFSLSHRPPSLFTARRKTTVRMAFVDEPFTVETQEGEMVISPETVDDWQGGYYVVYPDDGSKPYSMAPAYADANYEPVDDES